MKAGQVGVSEWAISRSFYTCDVLGGNVLYIMPTNEDLSDFSQMRFGPALEASPYLEHIVADSSVSGKRSTDRVKMKRIRHNFIVMRGGRVGDSGQARQLKSVPADLVIRDEVDEMDPRVREIADKRLGHSKLKHHWAVSTPSYINTGIDLEWQETDQREWHVPCPHCGTWQQITIDRVVDEWDELGRPVHWHGKEEGDAWALCYKCGKKLNRLTPGEWVPQYPDRDKVGYRPTKLITGFSTLKAVVNNLNTVNETKRKESYNQDLGRPFEPRGGRLSESHLNACRREYRHRPPTEDEISIAGVDVGDELHVVIRTRPKRDGDVSHQLYAGTVLTMDELRRLLAEYRVRVCVIDALPEKRASASLVNAVPRCTVWLAYYVQSDHTKRSQPVRWDYKEAAVHLDRTWTLDETFARFYEAAARANDPKHDVTEQTAYTLPADASLIPDYYQQVKAPVRVLEERSRGLEVAVYVESGPDHYCFAAGTMIRTEAGQVPIEQVKEGMRVATRSGWRKVAAAWQTSPKAAVRDYLFSNSTRLRATPNHPVYVRGKGFIPIDAVNYGDMLEVWDERKRHELRRLCTRASSFGAIPTARTAATASTTRRVARTERTASRGCTRRYGRTRTGRSQKDGWFTILMETLSTTISTILSVYRAVLTSRSTSASAWRTWTMLRSSPCSTVSGLCRKHGIARQRVKRFTGSWRRTCGRARSIVTRAATVARSLKRTGPSGIPAIDIAPPNALPLSVEPAAWTMRSASAPGAATRSPSTATARRRPARGRAAQSSVHLVASSPAGEEPVYNLTVEGAHEYYANGVLVHNCHAENYCTVASMYPLGWSR